MNTKLNTTTKLLTGGALVLAAVHTVYAQSSYWSPTAPMRPSAGLVNDWLRKDNPYASAWDIGMQTRLRYEVKDRFAIAGSPGSLDFRARTMDNSNAYGLLKLRPRVGYTAEWWNFMVEGRHSGSMDDDRGPVNPESDEMDLHQAFFTLGNHKEFPLSLKVGRQELSYGDERILGGFAWNNIGRVFDAAKVRWQNRWFSADFFTSMLVLPNNHNLNVPNSDDWLSGVYASTKLIPKQTTELYFLSRNAGVQSGYKAVGTAIPLPSPRDIYHVGLRMKSLPGEFGGWDYTAELMGQFGHFNDPLLPLATRSLEHRAYAAFLGAGYTWTDSAMTPRLGLEYNYSSGDSNPTDGKHETFENLFPTNHKFYGFMDLVSLQNLHNVRFTSSFKPVARLTLGAEFHAFWLDDDRDNFYAVTGARRGGIGASTGAGYALNSSFSKFVGTELDIVASYALTPQSSIEAGYGRFFRGDYVKSSLSAPAFGSKDANWAYVQLNMNF